MRDKCAIFEEAITFECTLYQHTKKKSFEEKHLECSLKEFLGKKSEDLCKTKLDLATFGQAGSYQFQSIPFKTKRKDVPPPTLLVSVKSTWVRVGDKKVVKGKGKDKDHSIELDGEAFGLETDMNASGTVPLVCFDLCSFFLISEAYIWVTVSVCACCCVSPIVSLFMFRSNTCASLQLRTQASVAVAVRTSPNRPAKLIWPAISR